MERLTIKEDDCMHTLKRMVSMNDRGKITSSDLCTEECERAGGCKMCAIQESFERLAEYENTNLTPEQIREIDKAYTEQAKELAELKNKGWIPVSERLPEERDSLFKNKFFSKTSDTVLVTVADSKGQKATTYACTLDGKWSCDLLGACSDCKIIAWQPFPQPYVEVEQ